MNNITIPQVLLVSLIGMSVVFAVLIILIVFIKILSFIVGMVENKTSKTEDIKEKTLAKGSCGEVAVFDVPDRIAAMAMAIVADETKIPLNELRFISIKEVEENK